MTNLKKHKHNKNAPYWAAAFIILLVTGLLTININLGSFWKSYVLDICGPAWTYILFRGLFTSYKQNTWTRFFTPLKTFLIIFIVAFGIEILQYFKVYDAVFDPFDFLAYISILFPLFLIDRMQTSYLKST